MVNYPTSLDVLSNPSSGEALGLSSTAHSAHHGTANDAIEALEAKLGIGAALASAGTVLRGTGAGSSAFGKVQAGDYGAGSIANADVAAGAGIALAKLQLGVPMLRSKLLDLNTSTSSATSSEMSTSYRLIHTLQNPGDTLVFVVSASLTLAAGQLAFLGISTDGAPAPAPLGFCNIAGTSNMVWLGSLVPDGAAHSYSPAWSSGTGTSISSQCGSTAKGLFLIFELYNL